LNLVAFKIFSLFGNGGDVFGRSGKNEILQAYVGRTQISRVKILAPWAKGAHNGSEKGVL